MSLQVLQNLLHGLNVLAGFSALGYLFGGALLGMIIGVIPGLGGAVVLSILIAFVYKIDITGTLCLFLGTYAGSYYSASVTSILLNTPAHPEAFAVTFDGFPMAQKGQAGRALGISAASTCIGGIIGCAMLVGLIQVMNSLPNLFHPPEYLALVTIAMLLIGTMGTDSVYKAIASMGIGFMVSSVGASVITGTFRYTFGAVGLYNGVSLVALALGLFAIPQMIMVFGTGTMVARQDMTGRAVGDAQAVELDPRFGRQILRGVAETFRYRTALIRAAVVGCLAGIVPGMGGFAANFLSYGIAEHLGRRRKLAFHTGIPEGIIAPEGASLAKEVGSMVPILALGIPGSVGGALFLGALSIKGIETGYGFTKTYPTIPYEIVWILALGGLIGTAAGVLLGGQLAKVTRVPGQMLVPFIFAFAVIGPFVADVSFSDEYELIAFAVIGLILRRMRFSLASFVLGLVLGPTFETNVYLTHNVYPGFSFLAHRPLADGLFVVAIIILVIKVRQVRSQRHETREALAVATDGREATGPAMSESDAATTYPLLGLLTTTALLLLSVFWIVYGRANYTFATAIFPVIAGVLVAVPMLLSLPSDIRAYAMHRQAKTRQQRASAVPAADLAAVAIETRSGRPMPGSLADPGSPLTEHADPASPGLDAPELKPPDPAVGSSAVRENTWGRNGQYTRELFAVLWLLGLIAICYLIGFQWGIPIFVGAYGLFATRRVLKTWRNCGIFAILSTAVMWAVTYELISLTSLIFTPRIQL